MIANSLRFRFLCVSFFVILIALPVAGVAMLVLFERNVMRQIDHELDADIEQLIANLERENATDVDLGTEPADPRFRQPLSGRYWQISSTAKVVQRSRSLWDDELRIDNPPAPKDGARRMRLSGPNRQQLYATARSIILEPDTADQQEVRLLLVVAMDTAEIGALKSQFRGDVTTALGALALLLVTAAWIQVSLGLKPLETLRVGVEKVRIGAAHRIDGTLPMELQPLAAETNRLLDVQRKAIESARARAGDLAHGLKTPLTALTMMAQRSRDEGKAQFAGDMELHLRALTSHVERELARTRIAAEAQAHHATALEPILQRLLKTLRALPRGDDIDWRQEGNFSVVLPLDEVDLAELLGNLLDNARKWAKAEVLITCRQLPLGFELTIADDGPGIATSQREYVLRRGKRLDETKPGSGLGLTIAKEIIEAYGGEMELGPANEGGLAVKLSFRSIRS